MSKEKTVGGIELVQRSFYYNKEELLSEDENVIIQVAPFVTEPAKVGFGLDIKWTPKRFHTAGAWVRYYVPCYREELDDVEDQITERAYKKLQEQEEYLSEIVRSLK